MRARRRQLDTQLRNAWVAELYSWWRRYNRDFLSDALQRPQIVILDTTRTLGAWDRARRTLGIAAEHIRAASWCDVLDTLRHEMAHQFVDEVAGARDESPHGPAFRAACARLRVRARATADPTTDASPAPTHRTRLLSRVEKLLSLADSPNENEASAAFRKARRLMVEHNLELHAETPEFGVRDLGSVKGRHAAWEFVLANTLDKFFFVDVIWAHSYDPERDHRGSVLRVYGTEQNLEMAEYVYAFLVALLDRLWTDYRAKRGIGDNRERLRYRHGVLLGFETKLAREDRQMRDREGLVVAADPRLRAFFRDHNPRIRTIARTHSEDSRAIQDGRAAGREINIHRPLRSEATRFGGYLGE